jgi:polyphosphate kinase
MRSNDLFSPPAGPALSMLPKELTWLAFNERVLQEAADPAVPVIERIRYLGIFSNNLDEFFRVRVADVRRLASFSSGDRKQQLQTLLDDIRERVVALHQRFDDVYYDVLNALRQKNIYLVHESQLDAGQSVAVRNYFQRNVAPLLCPILLDDQAPIPTLTDAGIWFGIKLRTDNRIRYAVLDIPSHRLPRFIEIPQRAGTRRGHVFIVLDNIIRHCLRDAFCGVLPIEEADAYTFKLTRDAELELGEGITQSLVDRVTQSLKKRSVADPVRFVFDRRMPQDLLDVLSRKLKIGRFDSVMSGARYHNSKDFMNFPDVGPLSLQYTPLPPIDIARLANFPNIFDAIRTHDICAYFPYHSFDLIIRLLKTAAVDPHVRSIKISLYRVASSSLVCEALISAAQNGKKVTAVVELQARFDEQANINWAQRLTDAGVRVIFGIPGLKVHAKAILIQRSEGSSMRYYSHLGTGNFNEKTARVYTDISLLTYDQEIGLDLNNLFEFLRHNYLRIEYRQLLVSPHSNRNALVRLIQNEIDNARNGMPASIMLKCNNLVDDQIVERLYHASSVGVKIRLIVRGMCSLIPGKPGLSENIEAIGIVDRFLEHPRIYRFENGGRPRFYISSADMMTRNLDHRVEITCPIYAAHAQQLLQTILDEQWADNVKARVWDATLSNARVTRGSRKHRSQMALHSVIAAMEAGANLEAGKGVETEKGIEAGKGAAAENR